jgi:putative peptide zinc metalloprotease protein
MWYVLQDHSSGRVHRFSPEAYQIIGLMNGNRTVQEIWEVARQRQADDPPTQEEMIRLLSQMHSVDILQCDVTPDTEELLSRYERQRKMRLKKNMGSPFAVRIPLLDPDKFLDKLEPIARLLFSWPGFFGWLAVVGFAIFQVGFHWSELTENITDSVLAPHNLVLLWFTFPLVKACHEFGHALAVKTWGGEVHEMGIMFLVFTPIPYMDASSASAFRDKRRRVVVGAAGILVELFIASLALFVWINIEPGTVRAIAYNVMLIAGVSTLVFNGNPLLRYDGYYILSDFLEIPNLGPRGTRYLGYLFQKYLLKIKKIQPPVATQGESVWFVIYTVAAFIYRIFVYTAIIFFVAGKFFMIGILLAIWGVISMLILPLSKGVTFLLSSASLRNRRRQAIAIVSAGALVVSLLLFYMPFPLWTIADGVVWIPEQSIVRSGTDGFVKSVVVKSGSKVQKGQLLVECYDPLLPAEVTVIKSQLRELQTQYDVQILTDRVQAEIIREEMKAIQGKLQRAEERLTALSIKSQADGTLIVPMEEDFPGKFVRQGEMVAYVVEPSIAQVRLVIPQSDVDFVRQRTRKVQVRFADNIDTKIWAVIKREVPGATDRLPSSALGSAGGGEVAIDPRDAQGKTAFQHIFEFELELSDPLQIQNFGGRVFVRFNHGFEPLAKQIYRGLRRLFLRRLNI